MKEAFLVNKLNSLAAASEDAVEALKAFPENVVLRVKITQPRSMPHHKFFFAFLNEVFQNWPEDHPFRPNDEEHLRAWLTVKAGWLEMMEYVVPTTAEAHRAIKIAKAIIYKFSGGRPIWFKLIGSQIYAAWPKSIKFEKMDEEEFKRFTTAIFTLIYAETSMDVEEHYERWQSENGGLSVAPTREKEESDQSPESPYFC